MAKNIRVVLSQFFGKRSDKDFHATAVRKMWDTHFHNNRKNYKDSVFNSHLEQTVHSASTARDKYVVPADKTEVLRTYLSELSKLQDSSVGEETVFQIEFSTSNPQNTKKSSNSLSAESTPLHKIDQNKGCEQSPKSRRNISKRIRPESAEDGSSGSEWDNSCDEDEESDSDYLSQPSESKLSKKSTKKKSHAVPKSMRDKFIRSLQTFRKRDPPSDEEKRALELFYHIERGIPKKDMIQMIKDAGIQMTSELIRRVHSKVKGAAADYLNYSLG